MWIIQQYIRETEPKRFYGFFADPEEARQWVFFKRLVGCICFREVEVVREMGVG